MSTYKTNAIILKIKDLGEYDQLVTLYAQEFGKIIVKAKSTKKQTAKLANQLSLFNLVNVRLAQGKTLDTIASVFILESFTSIKKNLAVAATAFCFIDLIDKFITGQQPDRQLWQLLNNALRHLNELNTATIPAKLHLALAVFQIRLLQIIGQHPELDHCCICQTSLVGNKNFCSLPTERRQPISQNHIFSSGHSGFICLQCDKANTQASTIRQITTSQIINLWQELADPKNKRITFKIHLSQLKELNKILNDFLSYQSSQHLQSLAFYRKITS